MSRFRVPAGHRLQIWAEPGVPADHDPSLRVCCECGGWALDVGSSVFSPEDFDRWAAHVAEEEPSPDGRGDLVLARTGSDIWSWQAMRNGWRGLGATPAEAEEALEVIEERAAAVAGTPLDRLDAGTPSGDGTLLKTSTAPELSARGLRDQALADAKAALRNEPLGAIADAICEVASAVRWQAGELHDLKREIAKGRLG